MTVGSSSPSVHQPLWEVAIVGAGLAGATTAAVLGRQGYRVILIDSRATCPACFKAEKIEPDQAALFREFNLLDGLLPATARIREVLSARGRFPFRRATIEQYGIFYQDMVNGVRTQIPGNVEQKTARVQDIVPGADMSRVKLMSGEWLQARLVILACGTGGSLFSRLGIGKKMISEGHSLTVGFNLESESGKPFPFDSLTYYPASTDARAAFLSLFPIEHAMRANYFTYWKPGEPEVDRFQKDPTAELLRTFPHLTRFTGSFRVIGRIEMGPADLYRAEGYLQPGLVLIGDAFQSVCPTTGTGVSKVLTDVQVLCSCIPDWLRSAGMGTDKLVGFYQHPRKVACDRSSLDSALYSRTFFLDPSVRWTAQRQLMYLWQPIAYAFGWTDAGGRPHAEESRSC